MATTTLPITLDELVAEILDGNFDSQLDTISAVIRERQSALANRLRFQLKPNDRVKVIGDIRPQYLVGLYGKVKQVNKTTVSIDFEDPTLARRYARGVRMPLACVEKA